MAVPAAFFLGVDTARAGMKSRAATHLQLINGTVRAHGPLVWETDQVDARVAVVVKQGETIGVGLSNDYTNGHATWFAGVHPTAGNFHVGNAIVFATMVSTLQNHKSEFYSWTTHVHLVNNV